MANRIKGISIEIRNLGKDKYDAFQREIIETENPIKSIQDEVKKFFQSKWLAVSLLIPI